MILTLSPQAVIIVTYNDASADNVGIMTSLIFSTWLFMFMIVCMYISARS